MLRLELRCEGECGAHYTAFPKHSYASVGGEYAGLVKIVLHFGWREVKGQYYCPNCVQAALTDKS